MNRRTVLPILLVVIVAASAFVIGRNVLSGEQHGAEAQEPTDTIERIDDDKAKPRFQGNLNGFTFYDPDSSPVTQPTACVGLPGGGKEATKDEISASLINFTADYIPAGLALVFEGGNKCGDTVVAIVRNYTTKGGGFVTIARIASDPIVPTDAPQERMRAATVAGRPAVVTEPSFEGDRAVIHMRDDQSYWMVSGVRVSLTDVIRVAEETR